MKQEKQIILEMTEIYKPNGYDWMGTKISKNNPLTYHHIIGKKRCDATLENGALLTKSSHKKLNSLKVKGSITFDDWQFLFMDINKSNAPLTEEHIQRIQELRQDTERELYGKSMKLTLEY